MKDYYRILGVDRDAAPAQIKKAYRSLAKKYHPDVNKGEKQAEARFKEINEAYAVLSDTEKRKQYDTFGAEGFGQRFSQEDIFRGFDFSVVSDLFGGGMGGGDDILSRLFGGLGRRPRGRRGGGLRKGHDYETDLTISLDEAFAGSKRRLSLQVPGGATMNLDVTIPRGVRNGQRLKLSRKGARGSGGGPPGDLLVTVNIAPHPLFKRVGDDLHIEREVSLTTLVLGGAIEVPTPEGPLKTLKVKKGAANNARMRIRGAGMPAGNNRRGDLYVILQVILPETLTERARELLEELRKEGL